MNLHFVPRLLAVGLVTCLTALVAGCGSGVESPLPTAPSGADFSVSLLGAGNAPATGEHQVELLRVENDPGVSTTFTYLVTSARKPPISYIVFPLPVDLDASAVLSASQEYAWMSDEGMGHGLKMGGFGPGKARELTVVLAGDLVAVDGEIMIKAANSLVAVPFQAPDFVRTFSVSGQVVFTDGAYSPVGLSLIGPTPELMYHTASGPDGSFTFENVEPLAWGTYTLHAYPPPNYPRPYPVTVDGAGQPVTGVEVVVEPWQLSISGTVRTCDQSEAGTPSGGITVSLVGYSNDGPHNGQYVARTTVTDSDGKYWIENLPPGTYSVQAQGQYRGATECGSDSRDVSLRQGNQDGVDLWTLWDPRH